MNLEISVPEVVEIFKEIQEQPEKLFEMIRFDIRETVNTCRFGRNISLCLDGIFKEGQHQVSFRMNRKFHGKITFTYPYKGSTLRNKFSRFFLNFQKLVIESKVNR